MDNAAPRGLSRVSEQPLRAALWTLSAVTECRLGREGKMTLGDRTESRLGREGKACVTR